MTKTQHKETLQEIYNRIKWRSNDEFYWGCPEDYCKGIDKGIDIALLIISEYIEE